MTLAIEPAHPNLCATSIANNSPSSLLLGGDKRLVNLPGYDSSLCNASLKWCLRIEQEQTQACGFISIVMKFSNHSALLRLFQLLQSLPVLFLVQQCVVHSPVVHKRIRRCLLSGPLECDWPEPRNVMQSREPGISSKQDRPVLVPSVKACAAVESIRLEDIQPL